MLFDAASPGINVLRKKEHKVFTELQSSVPKWKSCNAVHRLWFKWFQKPS